VGLSAGLKHFSLFERAKIGANAKKKSSISVALAPIFAPPKSEKRLERAKNPTETLTMQARRLLSTFLEFSNAQSGLYSYKAWCFSHSEPSQLSIYISGASALARQRSSIAKEIW